MAKSNYPRLNLIWPGGRYVSGDHAKKRTLDIDGRPVPPEEQDFSFGLAIAKNHPDLPALLGQFYQYAAGFYQNNQEVMQRMSRGFIGSKQGGFSWKIKDGDLPNAKGQPTPHGAGCYIFYMSTMFPLVCADANNVQIDPSQIKRGDYIDVSGSIAVNEQVGDRAGVYINPNIIRRVGYGDPIVSGPTPEQAFANRPAQLPQGASATPTAGSPFPAAPQQPGYPPQGFPGQQPGYPPQAPAQGFPMPNASPQYPPQTPPGYGAPPNTYQQPQGFPPQAPTAGPAGFPAMPMGTQFPMGAGGPIPQAPAPGMPYGAPPAQYPSNQPPQGGFPGQAPAPGFPGQPSSTTQFPIDPRTGLPVAPNYAFVQGLPR